MRLVAGSSAITLKLSSRMRCTRVFKGWYVSTKGILLIFSSVEFHLETEGVNLRQVFHVLEVAFQSLSAVPASLKK